METLFNPGAFASPSNTRPCTLAEMVVVNVLELLNRCEPEMYLVHVASIKNIVDDLDAVNNYCVQELTVIDARDTINRFADDRRPETAAAIAYAETLTRKQ